MKETLNQIRKKLDTLLTCRERVIVAIDGNCTSGKTTLAGALAELYDCNVTLQIYMKNTYPNTI